MKLDKFVSVYRDAHIITGGPLIGAISSQSKVNHRWHGLSSGQFMSDCHRFTDKGVYVGEDLPVCQACAKAA